MNGSDDDRPLSRRGVQTINPGAKANIPSPLVGEGGRRPDEGATGGASRRRPSLLCCGRASCVSLGCVGATLAPQKSPHPSYALRSRAPSSAPVGHLLPRGCSVENNAEGPFIPLLPSWEKVAEGRMRGAIAVAIPRPARDYEPTALGGAPPHPPLRGTISHEGRRAESRCPRRHVFDGAPRGEKGGRVRAAVAGRASAGQPTGRRDPRFKLAGPGIERKTLRKRRTKPTCVSRKSYRGNA